MPKVFIDGVEYEVGPGRNMLEAAIDNGLDLPYFCWHPAMGSVGACRLCAVRAFKDENDTKGRIQMACMTPAIEGARVSINDPGAVEFRRYVIEWLMTNHPHDCPVCDEGGECHLQDMTAMCGQVYRRFRFRKRTYFNQYLGPFVAHEMNRCIQCYRCVRFYRDLAGGHDLNVFVITNRVYFGRDADGILQSEFSGNLVEVCPTGVFTDKTLAQHYTRKWDLETAPSVCPHCSLGCNTIPGARYGELRRIKARFNGEVNGYFLCDRGRYGYEFVNNGQRVRQCQARAEGGEERSPVSWEEAISRAKALLAGAKGVVGIGSPRASLEANYALLRVVGRERFSTGLSSYEQRGAETALRALRLGPARTPSLAEVEHADVVVILGADPTNEAPMLDFSIRQAMRKAPLDAARSMKIPDWHGNAVAEALQSARGKLYIAAPWVVKLAEISLSVEAASYADVTSFAGEIRRRVEAGQGKEEGAAAQAAADLREARQPLVVTSITAGPEVVQAAAELAASLCAQGKPCWLSVILPEANTMGMVLLGGIPVDDALQQLETGKADTLVVLLNDLSRRVPSAPLERALAKAKQVIVLDCLRTPVAERADVLFALPAYAETDGTFVNNEGRAQRFFQVFVPQGELKPEWWALRDLCSPPPAWAAFEDALRDLARERPEFAAALEAAPLADWRSPAGQKVARMSHRFSGRTAKDANVEVKERQVPQDPQTPLAFSMEGDQDPVPAPLVPRFWWPGWNSEQAINKFQIEVGGPLHGGPAGRRLIEPPGAQETAGKKAQEAPSGAQSGSPDQAAPSPGGAPRKPGGEQAGPQASSGIPQGSEAKPGQQERDRPEARQGPPPPPPQSTTTSPGAPGTGTAEARGRGAIRRAQGSSAAATDAARAPGALGPRVTNRKSQIANTLWLVPRPRIFGSEELSRFSEGIADMTPAALAHLHPETAQALGVGEGDFLEFDVAGEARRLPVRLDDTVANGVLSVPAAIGEARGILAPEQVKVKKGV